MCKCDNSLSLISEVCSFHIDDCGNSLTRCDAPQSGTCVPTFTPLMKIENVSELSVHVYPLHSFTSYVNHFDNFCVCNFPYMYDLPCASFSFDLITLMYLMKSTNY